MKKKLKHSLLIIAAIIVILIIGFGLYEAINKIDGNFHTVIPGMIYRSAQPHPKTLEREIKQYNIKSILNMRGENHSRAWYQNEINVAKKMKIQHYDVKTSAHKLPKISQIKKTIFILQSAPKPILIHCRSGADRSGLASAISVILFAKDPSINTIEHQASWQYCAISPITVGHQFIMNYINWLAAHNLTNSKATFLQWIDSSPVFVRSYYGWFV